MASDTLDFDELIDFFFAQKTVSTTHVSPLAEQFANGKSDTCGDQSNTTKKSEKTWSNNKKIRKDFVLLKNLFNFLNGHHIFVHDSNSSIVYLISTSFVIRFAVEL